MYEIIERFYGLKGVRKEIEIALAPWLDDTSAVKDFAARIETPRHKNLADFIIQQVVEVLEDNAPFHSAIGTDRYAGDAMKNLERELIHRAYRVCDAIWPIVVQLPSDSPPPAPMGPADETHFLDVQRFFIEMYEWCVAVNFKIKHAQGVEAEAWPTWEPLVGIQKAIWDVLMEQPEERMLKWADLWKEVGPRLKGYQLKEDGDGFRGALCRNLNAMKRKGYIVSNERGKGGGYYIAEEHRGG